MQVLTGLSHVNRDRPTVLTIGAFDGVHRGHQYLIREVVSRGKALHASSMIVTFDPRPQVVLRPGSMQLTNAAAKKQLMQTLEIDQLVVLRFSHELASQSAGDFLASILQHVNVVEFWTGADFAFGHRREGTVDYLQEVASDLGFSVNVVPRQNFDVSNVSSTAVRDLVGQGEVARAAQLLGHFPGFTGQVIGGFGRGRTLGFPTANVLPPEYQQLPRVGIYAGYLCVEGDRHAAAISVGYNVVFGGTEIVVEAFVLDFDRNLRDKTVSLEFVAFIRDEQNFASVDELVAQMHRDVDKVREVFVQVGNAGESLHGR